MKLSFDVPPAADRRPVPNGMEFSLDSGEVVFVPDDDFIRCFSFSHVNDPDAALLFGRARLRADPGHVGADGLYLGLPSGCVPLRVGNIRLEALPEELPDVLRAIPPDWDVSMPCLGLRYLVGLKLI